MAKPGDKCPNNCGGQLIVITSRQTGEMQLRYLACNGCRCSGGKSLVPVSNVFSRKNGNSTIERSCPDAY